MTDSRFTMTRRAALAAGAAAPAALAAGIRPTFAAAPMLGASIPSFRRVTLGQFEVTTLLDGSPVFDGPHPIFGQDQEEASVHALMEENNLPTSKTVFYFNPVVVNTGDSLVLFDTGNAAETRPARGNLKAALEAAGYSPDQIDIVVITHMHPDHIGGMMEGGSASFPNASYVTGEAEYGFWSPEDKLSGPTERVATMVQASVVPLADKFTFIKDGEDVVTGITAVGLFGHTPGHMGYNIESDGKRLLLFADACNHFVASLQRPDWHVRFDMDKDAAGSTRKRLLDMLAADRIAATGYHMPFPGIGYVEKAGTSYRWVPLSYQLDI